MLTTVKKLIVPIFYEKLLHKIISKLQKFYEKLCEFRPSGYILVQFCQLFADVKKLLIVLVLDFLVVELMHIMSVIVKNNNFELRKK